MTKITVVGSFAVGLTIRSDTMPVFGETLRGRDFDFGPGGKGSNQAVGAARLGASAALVTNLGRDQLAAVADDLYAAENVDVSGIRRTDARATGAGVIVLNAEGENFIILDMGANDLMDAAFVDGARDQIAGSDIVMTVLEIPLPAARRAMELGRASGAVTILNPAPAMALPDEIFAHVDYLTPNETELRILMGLAPDDPTPTRDLALGLRDRGVGTVIVTMGPDGALILSEGIDEIVRSPAVKVVDTTGAGDAFNAGLATALGEGHPLIRAVRYATCCGAHACTTLGVIPSLPTRDEMMAVYASHWTEDT